jgi:hypothetical protein
MVWAAKAAVGMRVMSRRELIVGIKRENRKDSSLLHLT